MISDEMAAVAVAFVLSVEPTDRALAGWQPFKQGMPGLFGERPTALFDYLAYAGAG